MGARGLEEGELPGRYLRTVSGQAWDHASVQLEVPKRAGSPSSRTVQ